jgi:hypothetical protein
MTMVSPPPGVSSADNQHRPKVQLTDRHAAILHRATRDDLQAADRLLGLGAAMGLDQTDHHVGAAFGPPGSLSIAKVLPTPGAAPR